MRDTTRSEVLVIARYSAKWIAQFGKEKTKFRGREWCEIDAFMHDGHAAF